MDSIPLKVLQEHTTAFAEELIPKLEEALKSMCSEYEVHKSDVGGLFTIYIQEGGFGLRLGGTIQIDLTRDAWARDFVSNKMPRFKDDNGGSAGKYVRDGIETKSTINIPALNCTSHEMLESAQKAMAFTRIVLAGEALLNEILWRYSLPMGRRFLELQEQTDG